MLNLFNLQPIFSVYKEGWCYTSCTVTRCPDSLFTDMQELGTQLEEAKDAGIKLIVSDGVFSMDGSITPLPYVCVCDLDVLSGAVPASDV